MLAHRRAVDGAAGGTDGVLALALRARPPVPRVAAHAAPCPTAPPVLFSVTGGGERDAQWVLGSEDEPVRAELVLDAVDFCLLVGGRYAPDEVPRGAAGDAGAVREVLERAASLALL